MLPSKVFKALVTLIVASPLGPCGPAANGIGSLVTLVPSAKLNLKTTASAPLDTASTLGMCGERNAIANMITNGENEIIKLVCVDSKGNVGSPCGACREYMMQLSKNSKDIEILKNIDTKEIVKLEELIPDWWGKGRV